MTGPRIEPEWAMASILFADIRGFTTFADTSPPREAIALLNEFFELVIPVLTRHGGRVDKLLGDGLLGVVGAPEHVPDHADRALEAAMQMIEAVDESFGERLRIGIGVNSGLVLTGTVGGGGFTELGIIGDPVNVAARVQDATRALGEPLLVTEATHCLLERDRDSLVPRSSLTLRGKAAPITVLAPAPRNVPGTPGA